MRINRRCLVEVCVRVIRKGSVNFIRGNVKEFLSFLETSVGKFPCSLCTVEHYRGTHDIGVNEHFGIFDGTVHMGFCREMNDSVDIVLGKNLCDSLLVRDVRANKGIILAVLNIL